MRSRGVQEVEVWWQEVGGVPEDHGAVVNTVHAGTPPVRQPGDITSFIKIIINRISSPGTAPPEYLVLPPGGEGDGIGADVLTSESLSHHW